MTVKAKMSILFKTFIARFRIHFLIMLSWYRLPSACEAYPEASITLSGVSKTMGLPGLRIGWLVCMNPRIMNRLRELRDYTTICNSAPSEVGSLTSDRDLSEWPWCVNETPHSALPGFRNASGVPGDQEWEPGLRQPCR